MSATKWLVALAIVIVIVVGVMSLERKGSGGAEPGVLLQADRDFAAVVQERGGDGWADYFAVNGVMFPPSGKVEGREAIREAMADAFAPGNPRLVWEPVWETIADSGDLGYTIGRWQSIGMSSAGADSVLAEGNYLTVWEKDPLEGWRVAADIGNRDRRAEPVVEPDGEEDVQ